MPSSQLTKLFVFNQENQLLVIRRSKTAPRRPLQWDLPGGFAMSNEAIRNAACRELLEETQLVATDIEIATTDDSISTTSHTKYHWVYFACRVTTNKVKLSFEHDAYKWITLDEFTQTIQYDLQLHAFTKALPFLKRYLSKQT